jgi:hypothetical protein
VYPMLSVSLDCLRPVSCVPNVVSVSGLSSSCVLCTQCCQCLWFVFVLCPVYPMLSVSLVCLRPVSCVPNVVSVSGLSSSCVLCTQCCQCLWIVHSIISNVYFWYINETDLFIVYLQKYCIPALTDTNFMFITCFISYMA